MADEKKSQSKEEAKEQFRRQAALAILGAFVSRTGGFGTELERTDIARMVWRFADAFVDAENAPVLQPTPTMESRPRPAGRPAHPSDEWAVRYGDKQRRGFTSHEEAVFYAASKPGATVVLVSGPEMTGVLTAPASVP
jgi:hypothetical protein